MRSSTISPSRESGRVLLREDELAVDDHVELASLTRRSRGLIAGSAQLAARLAARVS